MVLRGLRKILARLPCVFVGALFAFLARLSLVFSSSFAFLIIQPFLHHPFFAYWHSSHFCIPCSLHSSPFYHEFHQIRLPVVHRPRATTTTSAYRNTATRAARLRL